MGKRKLQKLITGLQIPWNFKWLAGLIHLAASLFFSVLPAHAQEIPKHGFSILNVTPKKLSLIIRSGTNVLAKLDGNEALEPGGYTGILPCRYPQTPLQVTATGYPPVEIKQAFTKVGDTPLFVFHAKSKESLEVLVVPNAKDRPPSFYDAINLSSQPSLKIQANQKELDLLWGQRIRLCSEKSIIYSLVNGTEKKLESTENDSFLLIFFTDSSGEIQCQVTRDNLL